MLSPDLERFCIVVAQLGDATRAHRRVFGPSSDSWLEARRLLALPDVTARIAKLKRDRRRHRRRHQEPTEPVVNGDAALWRAVLLRAIDDAAGQGLQGEPEKRRQLQAQARAYLLRPSADLVMVCHLAGLEPSAVVAACARLLLGSEESSAAA